ncbi:PQQ-dependent dehydrogenase (s-GDH family) [Flavobacteriaceae bacterium MAR_2010_72]|nr:PQQ-dependent dehydrogenase (s-GDH family) [Flavobacteriaceae bacterium MAR_2010_72]
MILKLPTKFKASSLFFLVLLFFSLYSFSQGTLEVTGNGNIIINGSSAPNLANLTDFGNVETGSNKNNVFTLDNIEGGGSPNKRLNNINISINGSSDFNPSTSNLGSLKGNETPLNHLISFTPTSSGLKTATVTITFTNGTNSPYTFVVQGIGFDPQPEINVTGLGNTIADGDTTPSAADDTSFGSVPVGSLTNHFFTISNVGNASTNLIVSNNGSGIAVSGGSGYFSVNSEPVQNSIITGGNSLTFSIDFNPLTVGTHTANISIDNNDSNENPYNFTISGTAFIPKPEIQVTGNGTEIVDGDTTPSSNDDTDFGSVNTGSQLSKTFTINNTGNELLNISDISLSNLVDFSLTGAPYSTPVAAGFSTTFTVTYAATTLGTQSSNVTILNDDSNENPYTFTVQGTAADVSYTPVTSGPDWTVTNLTPNFELNNPNTIIYGPDNYLWITERVGKKVVKIDPVAGGSKSVMLDLSGVVYQTGGQDGLMGMAVHPDLYTDINTSNNYVYLAYTYNSSGRKLRIARFTYNVSTGTLNSGSSTTILEGFEASNDHNSGKLQIGPDMKLYYTAGDQGYNQFANACLEIRAQYLPTSGGQTTSTGDKSEYKGKILRMNLDGSIPLDNPSLGGFKTHIYTYGHRNPQGLVFGSDGKLYSSEHGPKVDDELNLIIAGKNYGWPNIAGYYDNQAYAYCNWSSSPTCNSNNFSDHNCPSDITPIAEFDPINNTILSNFQPPIGTYNSTVSTNPSGGFLEWPTVAPASLAIYEAGLIPNWGKSLLIPTLKRGTIFRAKLNATGDGLESQTYEEFHSSNDRYRDVAVGPDGITFYVITDSSGSTSGPSGTNPQSLQNPGVVMRIQYKCLIGASCDDGNDCTINDVYDSFCNCVGELQPDTDNDGVCDPLDQCPSFDDTLIGTACDDGDDCTINDVYTEACDCVGTYTDSDGDGVCDADDICPGFDDTIDENMNGIPDGCETVCEPFTSVFLVNPLTHLGSGTSNTALNLPTNSQDISFTINGIDQVTGGKPTNRYIDLVSVSYVDGNNITQSAGTFSGANASSANISITGIVKAITVNLSDAYDGNAGVTLDVNLGIISYCVLSSPPSSSSRSSKVASSSFGDEFRIYPNPVSTELIVERVSSKSKVNISMFSITGQLMTQIEMQNNRHIIHVDNFAGGLYLLRLTDENGSVIKTERIFIK